VETVKSPAEGRVILRNVSWETYERLLAEREESRVPRFFYDRGLLEIVSPSSEHDRISRIVALLVELLAAEVALDVDSAGSTTFRREDLDRGFEPDECFYFSENAARIRRKDEIDLSVDPPPDLILEVDVTSFSMDKLPIYARLGVPEVWRYVGGHAEILLLQHDGYAAATGSAAFPTLTNDVLARFVEEGLTLRRPEWMSRVREWARCQSA
jgi:Uma2 family endonuclease